MSTLRPPRRVITVIVVLLTAFTLLGCKSHADVPSQITHFPEDIHNPKLDVRGIYPDGWTGEDVSCNLQQSGEMKVLSVRGTIPQINDAGFRADISILLD